MPRAMSSLRVFLPRVYMPSFVDHGGAHGVGLQAATPSVHAETGTHGYMCSVGWLHADRAMCCDDAA